MAGSAYTIKDTGDILDRLRKLVARKNGLGPFEETSIRQEILKGVDAWVDRENARLDEKEEG